MTIYTLCVDQERGKYLAMAVFEGGYTARISHISSTDAVGLLVSTEQGITVDKVVRVEVNGVEV